MSEPIVTSELIRAARMLLRWEQGDLAERSGVPIATLSKLELREGPLVTRGGTAEKIRATLVAAGIEFINGDQPAGVRLRKHRDDRNKLDQHINRLEGKVAILKPAASGKPSPAKGMALLRRGRAKSDLAKAKNKRAKEPK
jgi:transcriptional regulator with XRE-family HTH domain